MPHTYLVMTSMMDEDLPLFMQRVGEIIDLLARNGVDTVEILFGWTWDDGWQPFMVKVSEIMDRIRSHEEKTGESFGENDVYIAIPGLDTTIVFCHESDLHLEFNSGNHLVRAVLNEWQSNGLLYFARKNDEEVALDLVLAEIMS